MFFVSLITLTKPTYAFDLLPWFEEEGIIPTPGTYCAQMEEWLPWAKDAMIGCRIHSALEDLSIEKTILTTVTQAPNLMLNHAVHGQSGDKFGACGIAMLAKNMQDQGLSVDDITNSGGKPILSAKQLEAATFLVDKNGGIETCVFDAGLVDPAEQVNRGSLLGLASQSYEMVTDAPPPVNLALYIRHTAQKIPIVNQTAFAATNLRPVGFGLILEIWELSRNFAYALMALFMLVIGFMIITRKKINPQTVVSVQTALPKVVISLILITFSYPIAAVISTFTIYLTAFSKAILEITSQSFTDPIVMYSGLVGFFFNAGNVIGSLLSALPAVLWALGVLFVIFKVLIINIKVLMMVMFAPIQFAFAVIPGQEKLMTDWFKRMALYAIAIPATVLVLNVGLFIARAPFLFGNSDILLEFMNGTTSAGIAFDEAGSAGFSLITLLLMSIFVMFYSLKVEKSLEGFIMGDKKK